MARLTGSVNDGLLTTSTEGRRSFYSVAPQSLDLFRQADHRIYHGSADEWDGSWTIVVADRDPGHPNWVSTAGHPSGLLWFRWFYPERTPDPLAAEVVPIDAVPATAPPPRPGR